MADKDWKPINEYLLPAELNRMTLDGQPYELHAQYVAWLEHFRNNQLATLTFEPLGGLTNAVFDSINEFETVVNWIVRGYPPNGDKQEVWIQLMVRSSQIGLTALHLAMGGVLQEAGALMRLCIESFAHSLQMEREPFTQQIWSDKPDESLRTTYKRIFEREKESRLYASIPELYDHYGFWCELGAHSTRSSLIVHSDGKFVSAQVESTRKIGLFLSHLLCSYIAMVDLARTKVNIAYPLASEQLGRIRRLGFYERYWKDLIWNPEGTPLVDNSAT